MTVLKTNGTLEPVIVVTRTHCQHSSIYIQTPLFALSSAKPVAVSQQRSLPVAMSVQVIQLSPSSSQNNVLVNSFLHFHLFLSLFFITTVLSHWYFFQGKFGLLFFQGKASCDRVALPNLRCMLSVLVFPQSIEL